MIDFRVNSNIKYNKNYIPTIYNNLFFNCLFVCIKLGIFPWK